MKLGRAAIVAVGTANTDQRRGNQQPAAPHAHVSPTVLWYMQRITPLLLGTVAMSEVMKEAAKCPVQNVVKYDNNERSNSLSSVERPTIRGSPVAY